ncbi:hypothetical protein NP493_257g03020 [Ridgeia piscesae]|uniref:Uncharacterized protein n=1 Tax=Ridgeia piscesae TaxID=27915 RepID=A0AAD9UCT6_RIDPI|nr:hypothetical protein NP493_257g03020 [Ridgeia piscesae]
MAKCIIQINCKRFVIHHKLDSDLYNQLQEIMFTQSMSFLKVHRHYVYWKTALRQRTNTWWRNALVVDVPVAALTPNSLVAPSRHKVLVSLFVIVGNTSIEIDVLCISRTTYEEGMIACKCT